MRRSIFTISVMALAALAMATGGMMKVFSDYYKVKGDSNLGKARCMACHAKKTGGDLNAYGKDLKALGGKKLTPDVLKKLDGKDSDGDGMKNGEEIKKDRNPGIKG